MDGQSQVCYLNGAETFKSPKNLKSFTDSIDSENMFMQGRKSDLTHNPYDDKKEEDDTVKTTGHSIQKIVSRNGLFGPKKKPSNRLSCSIDYKTRVESNGSLKRNKLSGRLGLGVGSSNAQQREAQTCFLCDKEGITQVGGIAQVELGSRR